MKKITLVLITAMLVSQCSKRDIDRAPLSDTSKANEKKPAPLYSETTKYPKLPAFQPGYVLVEFKDNESQRAVSKMRLQAAKHIRTERGKQGVWKIPVKPGTEKNYMAELKRHSDVKNAELNISYHAQQVGNVPNDPDYNLERMWHLFAMNVQAAWNTGNYGRPNEVTQLIDEPMNQCLPEFEGKFAINPGEIPGNGIDDDNNGKVDDVAGWNFVLDVPAIYQGNNLTHGQHTGGSIIAKGDNNYQVVGVARNGKILATPFLGVGGGWLDDAISAVYYGKMMKEMYPNEMNIGRSSNSWGGGSPSQFMDEAIRSAGESEIGFIAAAGNNAANIDINPAANYPAAYAPENPYVMPVLASKWDNSPAEFTATGKLSVAIGAPGVSVLSTLTNGTLGEKSGTSMACPQVAAADHLLRSVHPDWGFLKRKDSMIHYAKKVAALENLCEAGGIIDFSAHIYHGLTDHTEGTGCIEWPIDNIPPSKPKNFRPFGNPPWGIDPNDGLAFFGVTVDPPPSSERVAGTIVYIAGPNWQWGAFLPAAISGLPVSNYYPYCRFYDDWGNYSDTSNTAEILILGSEPPDTQSPTLNGNGNVSSITTSSITFNHEAASDNVGVASYTVNWRATGGSWLQRTSTNLSETFNGLSEGTTYEFFYTAKDAAGNVSVQSQTVNGTTLTPPPPPTCSITSNNLNAVSNALDVTLSWTANISGTCTIASTKLERWFKVRGTWTDYKVFDGVTSPHNNAVPEAGQYKYRLELKSSTGQTFYSNEKQIQVKRK